MLFMRRLPLRAVVGSMLTVSVLMAACGGGEEGSTEAGPSDATAAEDGVNACTGVNVTLSNFALEMDSDHSAAGEVTFCVDNLGPTTHEFKVVRSDLEIGKLPMDQPLNALVDETKVEIVAKLAPMQTTDDVKALTISLEPGTYYLLCNVPSHYQLGMHTAFTVE